MSTLRTITRMSRRVTVRTTREIGHASAVAITSGVTVLPMETPITRNTASRRRVGTWLRNPMSVANDTAAAGPVSTAAGKPTARKIAAPAPPMRSVGTVSVRSRSVPVIGPSVGGRRRPLVTPALLGLLPGMRENADRPRHAEEATRERRRTAEFGVDDSRCAVDVHRHGLAALGGQMRLDRPPDIGMGAGDRARLGGFVHQGKK